MLRTFGKTLGSIKRMAGDFQRQFNDALKDADVDVDEIKNMTSSKGFGPLEDARKSMEEFADTMKDPMELDPQIEAAPPKPKAATSKTVAKKPAAKPKAAAKKPAPAKTTGVAARKPAPKKRAAPRKKAAAAKTAEAKSAS